MPDAAIGADVMVGFPGETDADFEESRSFIDALPFTYLHVFTYSERPGTPRRGGAGHRAHTGTQGAQSRAARAGGGQEPGLPPNAWSAARSLPSPSTSPAPRSPKTILRLPLPAHVTPMLL